MEKKQATPKQYLSLELLMTDILFDDETLPMYEKCMTVLNEPDKHKIYSNLHDGKLLCDIMFVCNQFCKWANTVKEIGMEALNINTYLLFKKYYYLIRDLSTIILDDDFTISEVEQISIQNKKVHEYNSMYLNACDTNDEKEEPIDFLEVYDSIVQLQNSKTTVNEYTFKVIKQTVSHTSGLLLDITLFNLSANEATLLEKDAKYPFLQDYEKEYEKLKKQTRQLFDQHCPVLNSEHWYKMKTTEERAMSLASDKKLYEAKDECLKGYSEKERKEMDENNAMIGLLAERFPDDRLFDFKLLQAGSHDLLSEINYDNIKLFYRLVLRGNIIRCNLYPELKPQFEAWMKGEEVSTCNKWENELKKYIAPLKEHYMGKDFDGLWKELIKNNDNIKKSNRGKQLNCFDPKTATQGDFDDVVVKTIIGRMYYYKMFELTEFKTIAEWLHDGEKGVRASAQQIANGHKDFKDSTFTDDSKKKIDDIIAKYVTK